jgi:hypothetical protein
MSASPHGDHSPDPAHDEAPIGPSNRSFGLVFALVFTLVGTAPLWDGRRVRVWALMVAGLFGLAAAVAPWMLAPLNRLWLVVGLVMHRIVNPVIMAALFYLAVTPFGLVRQLLRKGLTPRLRRDPRASTYWIDRTGQRASRMDQQF